MCARSAVCWPFFCLRPARRLIFSYITDIQDVPLGRRHKIRTDVLIYARRKRAHARILIHRGESASRKNQYCLGVLQIRQAAFSEAFCLHKHRNTTICGADPQESSYLTFLPTAALAIFQHPASPTAASIKNVGMAG